MESSHCSKTGYLFIAPLGQALRYISSNPSQLFEVSAIVYGFTERETKIERQWNSQGYSLHLEQNMDSNPCFFQFQSSCVPSPACSQVHRSLSGCIVYLACWAPVLFVYLWATHLLP